MGPKLQQIPAANNQPAEAAGAHELAGASSRSRKVTSSRWAPWLQPERFSSIAHSALCLYCVVAPLSIGCAQSIVVPLLAYWLFFTIDQRKAIRIESAIPLATSPRIQSFSFAVAAWFGVTMLSSLVGIDAAPALSETIKTSIYLLLPFAVLTSMECIELAPQGVASRIKIYFAALVLGQSLAGLHTFFSHFVGFEIKPRPPGPVTESGQLVLVLPCLVGLLLIQLTTFRDRTSRYMNFIGAALSNAVRAAIVFVCLILVAWPQVLSGGAVSAEITNSSGDPVGSPSNGQIGVVQLVCILIVLALTVVPWLLQRIKNGSATPFQIYHRSTHLLWSSGALLLMSLVVNLKRGPWFGVIVALVLLGLLVSRKIAVATVAFAILLLVLLAPARHRLFNLVDDFTIGGGRQTLWSMGVELITRFPLGLGSENAKYMRELNPSLPFEHPHMHNNLLNVTVEAGWLGLTIYVWWIYLAIALGFSIWHRLRGNNRLLPIHMRLLALCISCALLGWQLAGMVEYNFGDGEVRLIALFLMGLALCLERVTPLVSELEAIEGSAV